MSTSTTTAQANTLCRATTFPNVNAYTKEEIDFSIGILEEPVCSAKEFLPLIKLATFGPNKSDNNSLRTGSNMLSVDGVEGDYDGEQYAIEEAVNRLNDAGIHAILYPTPRYTPEAPRWRVLMPFSAPFAGTEAEMALRRKRALWAVDDLLGDDFHFADESYTLSQSYYYGQVEGKDYWIDETQGKPIDQVYDLSDAKNDREKLQAADRESPPFDLTASINDILTGEDYHQTGLKLFGHFAGTGVRRDTALGTVQALMKANGDDSDRWRTRYLDLSRCCADVYDRQAAQDEEEATGGYQFTAAGVGIEATFGQEEPDPVPFVIEGILPQTAFGMAGAGGSHKTTVMLIIMINVILDKPVFGQKVLQPGPCVIVTAEDEIQTMRYRIRKLCDAMGLTKKEKASIGTDLIIEDVTGHVTRLVEMGKNQNLQFSPFADRLIDAYQGRNPSIMVFDPAVYFAPFEGNHVNEGPAVLMQYARRISNDLGCAAGYINHVGQEAYRQGYTDMYAGRGGSAYADNARAVFIMAPPHKNTRSKYPIPDTIRLLLEDQPEASVVQLHIPKVSYAKAPTQPVWILRDTTDAWVFHHAWGTEATKSAERKASEKEDIQKRLDCMIQIWDHITQERAEKRYPNRTAIRALKTIKYGEAKASAQRLREILAAMDQLGFVTIEDLPEELQSRNSKEYIAPATRPFIGKGGLELPDEKEGSGDD